MTLPASIRRRLRRLLVIPLTMLVAAAVEGDRERPLLTLVITVDQLRPDYLDRFDAQWTGGFRRLLDRGAVFRNAWQDHAMTETAAGDATVLSGRDPRHNGIAFNARGVQDPTVAIVGAPGAEGASPRRFIGTTMVDWLRRSDPAFAFLSVSRKDRTAIFLTGRSPGPVYWWVDGGYTTSTYYARALPAWLDAWNARDGAGRMAGRAWDLLLPDSAYAETDARPFEHDGRDYTFPHRFPADTAAARSYTDGTPWSDSLTLDVALEGARTLGLGLRGRTDLLSIGLSATDAVGHAYGPWSRELHDHLLRLDRWLGWFLDSLATQVPAERTLIVLTADHGVTPFPEELAARGLPGGRIRMQSLVRELNQSIGARTGDSTLVTTHSGLILADTAHLRALGVNPESLATVTIPRVWQLEGVANAWTMATLRGASPRNIHAVRWWRSLPDSLSWLICAVARPGYIWTEETGFATHGTTNPDDVGVPIIFAGPGVKTGRYDETVRTVDIAPTLARILDLRTEGRLDGKPLKQVIR